MTLFNFIQLFVNTYPLGIYASPSMAVAGPIRVQERPRRQRRFIELPTPLLHKIELFGLIYL